MLESLGPESEGSEREQALRDETLAVAEAAQALQRLATREEFQKLKDYVVHEMEDTQNPLSPGIPASQLSPAEQARRDLRTFQADGATGQMVLQVRHKPELLNSFDVDFWLLMLAWFLLRCLDVLQCVFPRLIAV